MRQRKNFGDKRQTEHCVYCGNGIETKEHVPPRVLLDEPYPENLAIIKVCKVCNQGYSLDEEYFACLIECARLGSVDLNSIERNKIRKILMRKPRLLDKLNRSINRITEEQTVFSIEPDRFRKVLLKIAQGHALFEYNEPKNEDDISHFGFGTLELLSRESRLNFEITPLAHDAPEVGSRAMQNMYISETNIVMPWINVQNGRYRYLVFSGGVRMVFSEYIWCEVIW